MNCVRKVLREIKFKDIKKIDKNVDKAKKKKIPPPKVDRSYPPLL